MKTKLHQILPMLLLAISAFVEPGLHAQSPFNGFPPGLPATIECEQFDTGGQNVGYYTPSPGNTGGKYRNEQVSIYRSQVYGGTYGYCVGTWPGEWLQYTVTSSESAIYRIEVQARLSASATGTSSFHINVNGTNATGPLTLWNYNTNWQTISATASIPTGTVALKLVIDSGDINYGSGMFDYITIYKVPPSLSAANTSAITKLSTNTDVATAKNNATVIQNAINALGSGGGTVTFPAGTYYLSQPNPIEAGPSSGGASLAPLCASQNDGFTRNDYTGWVGFKFTVGNSPLYVTQLGRWVVSGDSQTHTIGLFDANGNPLKDANNVTVSATLNTQNQPANQFVYAPLTSSSPYTLQANTTYALMSQEVNTGDRWYDYFANTNALNVAVGGTGVIPVATGQWADYEPSFGQLASAVNAAGQGYGPVSLLYQASPAFAFQNYAVWVDTNNVAIRGDPTSGTTLAAFNRDTTILLVGNEADGIAAPANARAITNILVQDLTFQGNPTIDWSGFYNPTGIVKWAAQPGAPGPNEIGSLIAFGGFNDKSHPINYTKNLVVRNCTFYNPSSAGITLWNDQDVLIQTNSWSYFNGITSAQVTNILALPGIFTQSPWVQNIAILKNTFNGNAAANPSMQGTDSACDGFVWLAKGGKWIVEGNTINNYYLEGIQMNAGPYTVVGNSYSTPSTCTSSCALSTSHDASGSAYSTLSSPSSISSVYCFVGNTVSGGVAGVNSANNGHSPYDLLTSANKLTLYHWNWAGTTGPSAGLELVTSSNVTVSANYLVQGDRGIAYQTSVNNSDNQGCNIYNFCNDFGAAQYSSLYVQDSSVNKLLTATSLYSRFGYNLDACHIDLGLPVSPTTKPTIFVEGIQFLNSVGSGVSPILNPAVGTWTDSGNGYGLNGTSQYWINNPNNFADGTFSLF